MIYIYKQDCEKNYKVNRLFPLKKTKENFKLQKSFNFINEFQIQDKYNYLKLNFQNLGTINLNKENYYIQEILILKNPIHKFDNSLGELLLKGKNDNNSIQLFYPIFNNKNKNFTTLNELGININLLKNKENEKWKLIFYSSVNYNSFFNKINDRLYKYTSYDLENCENSINLYSLNGINLNNKEIQFLKKNEFNTSKYKNETINNLVYNFGINENKKITSKKVKMTENNNLKEKVIEKEKEEDKEIEKKSIKISQNTKYNKTDYKINFLEYHNDKEFIPNNSIIVNKKEESIIKETIGDNFPKTKNNNTYYMIFYKNEEIEPEEKIKFINLNLIEIIKGFKLENINDQQIPVYNSKNDKVLIYQNLNNDNDNIELDLINKVDSLNTFLMDSKNNQKGGNIEKLISTIGNKLLTNKEYIKQLKNNDCFKNRSCLEILDMKNSNLFPQCLKEIDNYLDYVCKEDRFSQVSKTLKSNIKSGIQNFLSFFIKK